MYKKQNNDNIDREEIKKFSAMAERWWDAKGDLKALHDINPVRVAYIRRQTGGVDGKRVLDVGCGGGLLTEALAAAGARATGIDMAARALHVAAMHAMESGLEIDYEQRSAEQWVKGHAAQYDVVTCMELLEHVPDPGMLVADCGRLVKPGGDLFFATVNRTLLARILVIWAAENLFGLVRKGTHRYQKFIRPGELARWGRQAGLELADLSGVRYIPFVGIVGLCKDVTMNYLMHFKRA